MSKPPQLEGRTLLPPVNVLVERLAAVERDLAELQRKLEGRLPARERNGVTAHINSLTRRRQWYISRIRSVRPLQTLQADVNEVVHTAEAGV